MADYTEEQRVKMKWKSARVAEEWAGFFAIRIFGPYRNRIVGHGKSQAEAWADAAKRLAPAPESHKESNDE